MLHLYSDQGQNFESQILGDVCSESRIVIQPPIIPWEMGLWSTWTDRLWSGPTAAKLNSTLIRSGFNVAASFLK